MTTAPPIAPSSSANIYAAFQGVLEALKIRPKEQMHYHRWVDSWMKSGGLESAEETRRFFDGLLSRSHVCDWQLVQAAHAVRLCAGQVCESAWAGMFDWDMLERQARALDSGRQGKPARARHDLAGSGGRDAMKRAAGSTGNVSRNSAEEVPRVTPESRCTRSVTRPARFCWRKDLSLYRGLTDSERTGFLVLLEWFEN